MQRALSPRLAALKSKPDEQDGRRARRAGGDTARHRRKTRRPKVEHSSLPKRHTPLKTPPEMTLDLGRGLTLLLSSAGSKTSALPDTKTEEKKYMTPTPGDKRRTSPPSAAVRGAVPLLPLYMDPNNTLSREQRRLEKNPGRGSRKILERSSRQRHDVFPARPSPFKAINQIDHPIGGGAKEPGITWPCTHPSPFRRRRPRGGFSWLRPLRLRSAPGP